MKIALLKTMFESFEGNTSNGEFHEIAKLVLSEGLSRGVVSLLMLGKTPDEARDLIVKCLDAVIPKLKERIAKEVS